MKNQSILFPVLILIGFVGLGIFGFNFFWGKINGVRSQINVAHQELKKLPAKINILQDVTGKILKSDEIVSVALPPENPMVYVISIIKKQANDLSMKITNIRMNGDATSISDTLKKADLEFQTTGSYPNIIALLEKLRRSFPLTNITKVEVRPAASNFSANVRLSSYWANFPQQIPAVTEAISNLSTSESAILSQISSFEKPVFTELPAASGSSNLRGNPFGI